MIDRRLNDPALQSLEARLASLPPRLPAGDAQQLLYQCAFAAGQAAGQRANSRAVQRWMIAASLLALLCGGLVYRAVSLAHPSLAKSEHIHHAPPAEHVRSMTRSSARNEVDSSQLSVATAPERVVDFNWPRSLPWDGGAAGAGAVDPDRPVLTSRSHISPDSI